MVDQRGEGTVRSIVSRELLLKGRHLLLQLVHRRLRSVEPLPSLDKLRRVHVDGGVGHGGGRGRGVVGHVSGALPSRMASRAALQDVADAAEEPLHRIVRQSTREKIEEEVNASLEGVITYAHKSSLHSSTRARVSLGK